MDLNAILKTLTSDEAVSSISKTSKGKVSADTVRGAVDVALPYLLDGLNNQAKGSKTADSVSKALAQHGEKDTSDIAGFLSGVDKEDSAKIVGHLLGDKKEAATKAIAKKTGLKQGEATDLLSTIAPLLMSLVGKQTSKEEGKSGGSIGDLVGSLLGDSKVVGALGTLFLGDGKKNKGLLSKLLGFLK